MPNITLSEGRWLVIVKGGTTTARTLLTPSFAEVDAALETLKDEILNAMDKASKMKPATTLISEKEQKAWKAFQDIIGKDMPSYFQYNTLNDIAEAGIKAIRDKVVNKIKYDNYDGPN